MFVMFFNVFLNFYLNVFTSMIKTWTGLPMEESVRMTEIVEKDRKYVNGVANPRIEDG